MAYIDCVVDTEPMARSIHTVTANVAGTTAAVVGMKAAVIKSQKEAADDVCANVNRGFYTLIRSQISQKLAGLQSDVDSHLMQLNQQRKQLLAIKSRMERDYNNISARYIKLFSTINKSLEQRVRELDKPVMDFATRDMDKVTNRTNQLPALVAVSQEESVKGSQHIIAGNIKYRGSRVVASVSRFLENARKVDAILRRIMLPLRLDRDSMRVSYPVVVCESVLNSSGSRSTSAYVPDLAVSPQCASAMRASVLASAAPAEAWNPAMPPAPELMSEFGRMVETSDMSARAKDMAMLLFANAGLQTLKSGQQ